LSEGIHDDSLMEGGVPNTSEDYVAVVKANFNIPAAARPSSQSMSKNSMIL